MLTKAVQNLNEQVYVRKTLFLIRTLLPPKAGAWAGAPNPKPGAAFVVVPNDKGALVAVAPKPPDPNVDPPKPKVFVGAALPKPKVGAVDVAPKPPRVPVGGAVLVPKPKVDAWDVVFVPKPPKVLVGGALLVPNPNEGGAVLVPKLKVPVGAALLVPILNPPAWGWAAVPKENGAEEAAGGAVPKENPAEGGGLWEKRHVLTYYTTALNEINILGPKCRRLGRLSGSKRKCHVVRYVFFLKFTLTNDNAFEVLKMRRLKNTRSPLLWSTCSVVRVATLRALLYFVNPVWFLKLVNAGWWIVNKHLKSELFQINHHSFTLTVLLFLNNHFTAVWIQRFQTPHLKR